MSDDVFERAKPAHERYGFGSMAVGEVVEIELKERGEAKRIQNRVASYSQYHGKQFKTLTHNNTLHIKRIA